MDSFVIGANEGDAWMIMRMVFFGHGRWNRNNNDLFVFCDIVHNRIKIGQHKFIADIGKTPPFLYMAANMTSYIHLAIA
jgi:hypothetical protein